MSILLATIGTVLLVICLAGVVLGIYMASDGTNREAGVLFALCWVSGASGAAGVAMQDGVTFLVGTACFLVAGTVFLWFGDAKGGPDRRERGGPPDTVLGGVLDGSEKTTKENKAGHRRAAS